ncbi:MAG: hypothetical protein A3F73_10555 [Gallionellales bacterium RIFCSPLOWO2_12_FULL_59_22]|nr:MAG: hypothetical protein A2Z65_01320 [Gallionellales bacterium RIFCSPLOWO2_02_58_13]OGT14408.1 MAG: hypothetical protein A3F73_10555 [Gallionellales bacterium RIFCSPLOWO2_12_FULL_59_22]
MESLLGVALTLRGAEVRFLLCDGVLPACQECEYLWLSEKTFAREGPQAWMCGSCHAPACDMLSPLGLPILRYSQFLGEENATAPLLPDLPEHVHAGALRYFGRGSLPEGGNCERILSRYHEAARMTARMMAGMLREWKPDVAVFHHGMYVPQGVVGSVLRAAGVRVANWGPSYRKGTVLFSHGDSYHRTMIDEDPALWSDMPWPAAREAELMAYLSSRRTGGNDWISFQAEAEQDNRAIADRLALDFSRPVIGLLTNVVWDAQLHFRQSAFPSMLDWLFASIEYFIGRTDLQLVIRIHPAEVLGTVPSRQRAADEIYSRFGVLPRHIKIVGPDEKISTYALMSLCNSALVYGTKTAIELACTGLPVVVAGEAWSRGKGFTVDVSSPGEYRAALDRLPFPAPLSPEQVTAARKYAYYFFFRRMIPVRSLKPLEKFAPYAVKVDRLDDLQPGADAGLDAICDGILDGRPFVI